ncbi:MAG: hypothetical protein CFE25_02715 [Chitinophagaceae bacterium BSSC1]|nr:MAG: hypothetical protein CFE25_02715 [Chitinophagaceae bacterium BSSC1]
MNQIVVTPNNTTSKYPLILPIVGIIAFVSLYILASLQYPGGSQADPQSKGFSWMNNYFCNLLNQTAINGQTNQGQTFALASLVVLAISLALFWWSFPNYLPLSQIQTKIIRITGVSSMVMACLLFTNINHDVITNTASLFGLIAILTSMWALYQNKQMAIFVFGLFNLLLVLLNNWFYYDPSLIKYLPLVQKISFASVLIWMIWINLNWFFAKQNEKP